MDKKKRTSYLLLGVVAIYAAIVIRFFLLTGDNTTPELTINQVGDFKPVTYTVAEAFTIANDHRDPFLGTVPKGPTKKISSNAVKTTTTAKTPFPTIQYMGVISDSGSSAKILSIKIKNIEYVVREGDEIEGVRILSGNDKAIKVRFKGEQKIINMQGI